MFKYDRVTKMLMDEISRMSPDTRLPSRTQLCERFGVTRTTIDKAISLLTASGYLQSVKGSGTYVTIKSKVTNFNENSGPVSWAVIMPDVMDGVYTAILRGVSDIANENNISVSIFNTDNDAKRQHEYVQRLVEQGVNGVIIIPAITEEFVPQTYELLKARQIPFVFCNRNVPSMPEVPFVCSNNFYGAYIGTKHMIAHGYTRIAFISQKRYSSMMDRYFGYVAAMQEHGLAIDHDHVVIGYDRKDATNGYQTVKDMFEAQHRPDGIFCAYEGMAAELYRAIGDLGLRISEDIGVISYDSSNLCEMLTPRLTAVSFQGYQAGYQSALILKELMFQTPCEDMDIFIFQPTIDIRQSCLGKQTS